MKKFIAVSLLLTASVAMATPKMTNQSLSIETFIVANDGGITGEGTPTPTPTPVPAPEETPVPTPGPDKLERVGKVVSAARDMIALGEAFYELIKKGKPTNVTEYAPVSVVPRDPTTKEYADPFDLENFSMPVQQKYVTVIKSAGIEVVRFAYTVVFSYGGSFEGKGKYLTGVLIVPSSVKTRFGWDVNATMKVSGIMNHGSKAAPVAGLMVTVKYQMNSWTAAFEQNDTFHITGRGQLKAFTNN